MTIRSYVPVLGRNTQRVCGWQVDGADLVAVVRGRVVVATGSLVRGGVGAAVVVGSAVVLDRVVVAGIGVVDVPVVDGAALTAAAAGGVALEVTDVPDVGVGDGDPHMLSVTAIAAKHRAAAAASPMNRPE